MNILMLVRAYPTTEDPVTGIFTKELVRVLEEQGNNVYVYSLRGISLINFFKYRKVLREKKIDIVHAQFGFPAGFWGAFFTKKHPLIVTIHRTEIVDKKNRKFLALLKFGLKKANKIIAVSEYIANEIFKLNERFRRKTIVLHNGIDLSKFKMKKARESKKEFIIGTLGNHIPRKGINLLIQAYKEIQKHDLDVQLLIAGSGPETQNLKSLSSNLDIKNVKFIGRIPEIEKNEFYQMLDIFVLSSFSEGHPITLLEAMSTGCCVVVSDIPSIQTTVEDQVNGCIFETGNTNDLYKKILELVNNPDKINKFGTEANKTVIENFDLHKRATTLSQIYKEILEN